MRTMDFPDHDGRASEPNASRRTLDRRTALLQMAAVSGAVGLGAPATAAADLGRGAGMAGYGRPSSFVQIQRRSLDWLTATRESGISFAPIHALKGAITPNGLHFERHHSGVPDVDPATFQLLVHGAVDRPLVFTLGDLMRLPSVTAIHFIECAGNGGLEWRGPQFNAAQFTRGMLSCSEWTGVRLSTLLDAVGVRDDAKWVLAEGGDASRMTRSIPIDKAMDDALICYAQNGEPLRAEQGFPVRLLNPGWEGSTSIKWLRRLEIGDQPGITGKRHPNTRI